MIIGIELQGGLGNQLFQYATARALAGPSTPILNIRLLRYDTKRRLALDAYPIKANILDSSVLDTPGRLRRLAARAGFRTGSLHLYPFEAPVYREDDSQGCYDERVTVQRAPVVLHGYFQSERYFAPIATELRAELMPLRVPPPSYLRMEQAIRSAGPASVSLHVRRGDYASDPKILAFHGLLGPEYYSPALSLLCSHVDSPQLFVFTDDPLAAAALLPNNLSVTMVSGQGLSDVDELALMSRCRHHIIANSSYSWWGAWLGQDEGLTIAPRRWFANATEAAIRDRFPSHWNVIG